MTAGVVRALHHNKVDNALKRKTSTSVVEWCVFNYNKKADNRLELSRAHLTITKRKTIDYKVKSLSECVFK